MFEKLFNLFRKKPAVIQEELPPVPSPVKKTTSCCGGKCGPRPQKSKRQLKPVRERDLTTLLDPIEDIAYNAVYLADTLSQRNHSEDFKSAPVEPHHSGFHTLDSPTHSHSYDAPSHSHSYDSHSSHDSGGSYDSGSCDSGGGCDGGGGCD